MANQIRLPKDVNKQIVEILKDKPSTLKNVLSWIAFNKETKLISVSIQVLESAYASNYEVFQALVHILGEDLDELKRNPNHQSVMNEKWLNHTLNSDETNSVPGQRLDFQLISEKKKRFELMAICLSISILLRLDVLTPEMLQKCIPMLNGTSIPFTNLLNTLNIKELLNMAQKLSGDRYEVSASFGYFVYDILQNRKRLENQEISGVRCIKNIIDSFLELGPGVAGGFGGEVFASSVAPTRIAGISTLVGGVGGGTAMTFLTGTLSDRITQWIFNLPKDEALENAFCILKLPCNASNNEINISFIRLSHQWTPNLSASPDWVKLKQSMNVIKRLKI